MKEFTMPADVSRLNEVLSKIEEELENTDCPIKTQMQIALAVEEIFVNIANYAYDEAGNVTMRYGLEDKDASQLLTVQFTDSGIPFDPLAMKDPDMSLSLGERRIGGLGIYMVKQIVDDISYEYIDCKNILTLRKIL